jgi:hypothetical protein
MQKMTKNNRREVSFAYLKHLMVKGKNKISIFCSVIYQTEKRD